MTQRTPAPWSPGAAWQQGDDPRLFAPATQRNRDAILEVLHGVLPPAGLVLEIASGSGEHAVHFARAMPGLAFQPSDPAPDALVSIAAWTQAEGAANVRPPLLLDAMAQSWPLHAADAILCINMIHIAPWAATQGLMRHAASILSPGAPLYLYGPYRRPDRPLEPGNAAFDENLRRQNPDWSLRELDSVAREAAAAGFGEPTIIEMPANNLSVIFRRLPT